jgi:ubiquinone/menaquinone biosynthesis C-methylase UbiE
VNPLVPPRAPVTEEELLDVEPGDPREIAECLDELARVNRLLGGRRATVAHLEPLLRAAGTRRVSVLDVAAGGGDMAFAMSAWAARRGWSLRFTLLDRHPIVLDLAGHRAPAGAVRVRADAVSLPFADGAFDVCVTSLFFHHLERDAAAAVLREMSRVARVGVLVNDLVRDRVALGWFRLLSRLFSRNRLVLHDGPVSVRRAWRPEDFRRLAVETGLDPWEVRRHFPYRMTLAGFVSGGRASRRVRAADGAPGPARRDSPAAARPS